MGEGEGCARRGMKACGEKIGERQAAEPGKERRGGSKGPSSYTYLRVSKLFHLSVGCFTQMALL